MPAAPVSNFALQLLSKVIAQMALCKKKPRHLLRLSKIYSDSKFQVKRTKFKTTLPPRTAVLARNGAELLGQEHANF